MIRKVLKIILYSFTILFGLALVVMSFFIAFEGAETDIIKWAALLVAILISLLVSCSGVFGLLLLFDKKEDK